MCLCTAHHCPWLWLPGHQRSRAAYDMYVEKAVLGVHAATRRHVRLAPKGPGMLSELSPHSALALYAAARGAHSACKLACLLWCIPCCRTSSCWPEQARPPARGLCSLAAMVADSCCCRVAAPAGRTSFRAAVATLLPVIRSSIGGLTVCMPACLLPLCLPACMHACQATPLPRPACSVTSRFHLGKVLTTPPGGVFLPAWWGKRLCQDSGRQVAQHTETWW